MALVEIGSGFYNKIVWGTKMASVCLVMIFNQIKSLMTFILVYPKRRRNSAFHIPVTVCFSLLFPELMILGGQCLHITKSP